MARKHRLDEVLRSLSRKKDVKIEGNKIYVLVDKIFNPKTGLTTDNPKKLNDLGNGSWGKISYLMKCYDYSLLYTSSF